MFGSRGMLQSKVCELQSSKVSDEGKLRSPKGTTLAEVSYARVKEKCLWWKKYLLWFRWTTSDGLGKEGVRDNVNFGTQVYTSRLGFDYIVGN